MNKKVKAQKRLLEERKRCPAYSKSKRLNRRIWKAKNSKGKGKPQEVIARSLKQIQEKHPDLGITASAQIKTNEK